MAARRVFLLSPANCGGERAQLLFSPNAGFELARRLRTRAGAPLGEVMSFVSGLYFRGKLTYAARFGVPLVITPHAGLRPPDEPVTLARLPAPAAGPAAGRPRRGGARRRASAPPRGPPASPRRAPASERRVPASQRRRT